MSVERIEHDEVGEITALFLGKTVTKVGFGEVELSDGTRLTLQGNEGGCSCGAGDYELTELNSCENIITNVEILSDPGGEEFGDDGGMYKIFVYAEDKKINLATFEGSDGNGWYGTGFQILVKRPSVSD